MNGYGPEVSVKTNSHTPRIYLNFNNINEPSILKSKIKLMLTLDFGSCCFYNGKGNIYWIIKEKRLLSEVQSESPNAWAYSLLRSLSRAMLYYIAATSYMWLFKIKLMIIKQKREIQFPSHLSHVKVLNVTNAHHSGQCRYKPLSSW